MRSLRPNTGGLADRLGPSPAGRGTSLSGEFYFNLSLGNRIAEYEATALADAMFVLDETKVAHQIIGALRSHNWYEQNPAVTQPDATAVSKMTNDSLFVIGRNIYQAACGSSLKAIDFVEEFVSRTRGYDKARRKALLDGMLFEAFFDSKGALRNSIKAGYFNEVFDLARYAELGDSFQFIAEALIAAGGDYYAVPGKGHEVAVTVSARAKSGDLFVEAIYIGGANVLHAQQDVGHDPHAAAFIWPMSARELNDRLSEHLAVPARLLRITYTPPEAAEADQLYLPIGWTVRKL